MSNDDDDDRSASVFPHAVASFEPTATGILLWTRLSGGETGADWSIATDADLQQVVASGHVLTDADRDHTVVVDVQGLEPATTYWYRFSVGPAHSPVGRTRTLPLSGVESFRLGTVCCADYSTAPFGVYRAMAEREVDLVLHLGDYIYEDDGSGGPRRHDPPHAATTLDDYRARLGQIRTDPDARALHLRHPMVTIWDDHDLADNAWATGAKSHDPSEHGPWADRAAAAARARAEWLPARLRDPDDPLTTWRSMPIGDLAELLLLDTRLVGRDRQAGDDESPDLDDPDRSLLGEEQRAWLHERLQDTERPWALMASGVVVNELELPWPRPLRWINGLLPNGYAVLDGRVLHDDQWDGYPAERRRVARWMADRCAAGGRTVILSGDVHSSWAFEGPTDPAGTQPVAVEMTTPAVSSASMGRAHYPGLWRLIDRAVNDMDHVRWADVTERGYGVLHLTPESATATWTFVHPYADEPGGHSVAAAAFRTSFGELPPRFVSVDPDLDDPSRPGLPGGNPGRPDNLRRLRIRRNVRIVAKAAATATALVAPVALLARRRSTR